MSNLSPKRERIPSRLYQNSYRLVPKRKFNEIRVKERIQNAIELHLQEFEYTEQLMHDMVKLLADEIRNSIKEEKFDRCRLVVCVTSGQKKMEGLLTMHSFLWDHERDNFVEHTYEHFNYYIQVVVYGVYLD